MFPDKRFDCAVNDVHGGCAIDREDKAEVLIVGQNLGGLFTIDAHTFANRFRFVIVALEERVLSNLRCITSGTL